eukprot:6214275-Pleurochrysis_carterae.AAC.1
MAPFFVQSPVSPASIQVRAAVLLLMPKWGACCDPHCPGERSILVMRRSPLTESNEASCEASGACHRHTLNATAVQPFRCICGGAGRNRMRTRRGYAKRRNAGGREERPDAPVSVARHAHERACAHAAQLHAATDARRALYGFQAETVRTARPPRDHPDRPPRPRLTKREARRNSKRVQAEIQIGHAQAQLTCLRLHGMHR